jgi:hypothetical protein
MTYWERTVKSHIVTYSTSFACLGFPQVWKYLLCVLICNLIHLKSTKGKSD